MGLYPAGSIFGDSLFQDQTAQALADKQLAENRLQQDWGTAQVNFGWGSADALKNPFGQQQLLNRNQAIEATDQRNNAARMPGGVRTGAYGIRRKNLAFGQDQQQASLRASYDAALRTKTRAGEDIASGYNKNLYNAGLDSLQRALNAPPVGDTTPPPPLVAPNIGSAVGGQPSQSWAPMGKVKKLTPKPKPRKVGHSGGRR